MLLGRCRRSRRPRRGLIAVGLATSGCPEKGPAEKAGAKIDDAVDKTKDAAKDVAKEVKKGGQ
jgi:outer membrane lipoprotein-sorting protein